MIATPQRALEAAAAVARDAGYAEHILGDALEGEARDVGKVLAGIALQITERRQPFTAPCILLSGGETRRSTCAATAAAGATSNACCRSAWRWMATRESMPWPATPTVSTARKNPPAHFWRLTHWREPGNSASSRKSRSSVTRWSPGRR